MEANSGAVSGTSAVEVTSVISTSVASSPISAASAGDAIIGEAMACSISARNRSGVWVSAAAKCADRPTSAGTAIVVQPVAISTSAGRRRCARRAEISTRMKEMQSRRKIASVT